MSCPHIFTADEGTSHCTLASVTAEQWKKMRDEHTFLRAALMDMVFHGGRVSQKGFKQKAYYDAFCEAYSNAKELLNQPLSTDEKTDGPA